MKTSENGISMIEGFEGFRAQPYPDSAGYMTVGYGHKLLHGEVCDSVTEEEAATLLGQDLLNAEGIVNRYVKSPLNQNQFDALVSFVFNVGRGAQGVKDGFVYLRSGNQSTMLRKLNAGDYAGAADQFPLWDRADGIEVEGLKDRRLKEQALFMTPVQGAA